MSKSLLKSSGIVSLMTLLSRVLGFVRDVLFAIAFGAGAVMADDLRRGDRTVRGARGPAAGASAHVQSPICKWRSTVVRGSAGASPSRNADSRG